MTDQELARFLLDCVMYRRDHQVVRDPEFEVNAMYAAGILAPIANGTVT